MVLNKMNQIDKICDVMWWTSDSKQPLIILCLSKYLSESFETLQVKLQDNMQKIFEKNWLS